jgi:hypothetical protein
MIKMGKYHGMHLSVIVIIIFMAIMINDKEQLSGL